jgi:iron complex outermembrane receptor protein
LEPGARLQWNLTSKQLLWGAVSHAVRVPSRIDRDISQPAPPSIVILKGGRNFDSESVLAYEIGYRAQVGPKTSVSLSTFFNDYHDVRSTTTSPPDPVFNLPFPFFFENNLEGETYGFELNASYQVRDGWRLHGGYTLLREDIRIKPGRTDFNNARNETSDTPHQLSLRSSMDLPGRIELDLDGRWVDTRQVNNVGAVATVPGYAELNVRLGWRAGDRLDLSVVGVNLLHDRHPEFGAPTPTRVEIGRSVYGKATWRF